MKYPPLNYASSGGTPETIGVTGESVEQFKVMSFFERRNNFLRFLQISPKGRILQKKASLYEICALKVHIDRWYSGNDRSYGWVGRAVWSRHFLKDEIIFSVVCKYLLKDASYRKRPLLFKHAPLNYASIGGTPETIRVTGESVEQFKVMSFFERRNSFLRFLQISPKGRILQKKTSLHKICAIK